MLEGNGYFVWQLGRIAGGDPALLARQATEAHLSWVALKIADGPYAYGKKNGIDLTGAAVSALKSAGIKVWGWHYVYGEDPEGEAAIAVKRTLMFDLDGYIIDAEGEYKNRRAQASKYMQLLRGGLAKPLAICTYRYPNYHGTFPFKEFASCDINMPQVYWMGAQNAGQQLRRTKYEYDRIGYRMPMVPVGAAFSEHGWTASVTSVYDFRTIARDMKLPGYGWWEWYEAYTRTAALWGPSTEVLPPAPEPNAIKWVRTVHSDLRFRSEPSLNGTILGYLQPNQAYAVTKVQGVWGYIPTLQGWVHLGYCVIC